MIFTNLTEKQLYFYMLQKFIAKLSSYLNRLAPGQPIVPLRKALPISIGVGVVVFALAFLNMSYGTPEKGELMVLAVFAVSALLIFLFPNSKLYSPLVILEANLFASFVALTCAYIFPSLGLGLAVSMFCTTLGLHFLNCMHPPAFFLGAILVMAGGGSLDFAFYPIAVDSFFLCFISYFYRAYLMRKK